MDDEPRALTDACMKLTGLGVQVAKSEQDLLNLWRMYVVYWQGLQPKDELLGFLHALAAEVQQIQADVEQDGESARMAELFKMQENVLQTVVLSGTFHMMELFLCALKQRREAGSYEQFHAKFELMTKYMMQNMKVFSDERHAFEELQLQHAGMLRAEYEKAKQEVLRLALENTELHRQLKVERKRRTELEVFNLRMISDITGMSQQNLPDCAL